MKSLIRHFADLFYPRLCLICERSLMSQEQHLCLHCLQNIPKTNFHTYPNNPMEQLFMGKSKIEKAAAYFYFTEQGDYRKFIHAIKYKGEKEAARYLGALYASELKAGKIFQEIDLIIPIPLHKKRERKRGYNQSEWIAKGISEVFGTEIRCDAIERIHQTETQTHKSGFERWSNSEDIFQVLTPNALFGKHILLIDDVITTGATLQSCVQCISDSAENVKISILTLSITQ